MDKLAARIVAEKDAKFAARQAMVPPDLSGVKERLRTVQAINTAVATKSRHKAAMERLSGNEAHAASLTAKINSVEAKKQNLMETAVYPVDGLRVDGDNVLFHKVPIEQCSAAQKIQLGLAVGAALNPALPVALIRDGSLMDEQTLQAVSDWADRTGFQVWIERVGQGIEGAIEIEEGEVVGAPKDPTMF